MPTEDRVRRLEIGGRTGLIITDLITGRTTTTTRRFRRCMETLAPLLANITKRVHLPARLAILPMLR